jgi:hypothetical protein
MEAYRQSKLGIILLGRYMSVEKAHLGVKFFSQHPGVIRTELGRDFNFFYRAVFWLIGKSLKKGAETLLHLVESPIENLEPGAYYANKKVTTTTPESHDHHISKNLQYFSIRMKKLSDFFYKKANWISCILFTAIMVTYAALVMGGKSACFQEQLPEGFNVLGLKTGYSMAYVENLFGSMDESGLICYRNLILIWDNIFPVLYGIMYIFWQSFIFKNTSVIHSRFNLINLYPLIPVVLDWTENFFELELTNNYMVYKTVAASEVQVASTISQIKWGSSTLNYIIILTGLILLIIEWVKQRKRKSDRSSTIAQK